MFAIIETGGKQYKVNEGDIIFIEKLDAAEGENVTFDKVLAVSADNGLLLKARRFRRRSFVTARPRRSML